MYHAWKTRNKKQGGSQAASSSPSDATAAASGSQPHSQRAPQEILQAGECFSVVCCNGYSLPNNSPVIQTQFIVGREIGMSVSAAVVTKSCAYSPRYLAANSDISITNLFMQPSLATRAPLPPSRPATTASAPPPPRPSWKRLPLLPPQREGRSRNNHPSNPSDSSEFPLSPLLSGTT